MQCNLRIHVRLKPHNTSVHVEKTKPVLGRQCQFISKGSGCHTPCSTDSSKHSCSFSSSSTLPDAKRNLLNRNYSYWEKSFANGGTKQRTRGLIQSLSRKFPRACQNITLPPPMETSRHSTLESSKMNPYEVPCRERETTEFETFPTPLTFSYWQIHFRTEICSSSCHPSAMSWMRDIELAQTLDNLKTSQSTAGNQFSNFEMLDAKVATASKRILTNMNLKKKSSWKSRKPRKLDDFFEDDKSHTRFTNSSVFLGTIESILDFTDLMNVTLRGHDVQGPDTKWNEVLLSVKEMHGENMLESMYKARLRDSEQLKTTFQQTKLA